MSTDDSGSRKKNNRGQQKRATVDRSLINPPIKRKIDKVSIEKEINKVSIEKEIKKKIRDFRST